MQEAVLCLRASGKSTIEIAKEVGLSARSIQRIARTTAYHEAGHAAAGAIFKQNPDWASIVPDPKTSVLAEVTKMDRDLNSKEGLKNEIINYYAGQCAELRAGGSVRRAKSGAIWDDKEARDCIVRICGKNSTEKQLDACEKKMRKAAGKFVDEHWSLVERIAAELLEHTTLVWEELDGLRAIYQGEGSEEDLDQLRKGLDALDEHCSLIGKKAVYKGSTKQFGPKIISTWSCE